MPNTASAKKSLRQNLKRRQLHRSQRSALRTAIKRFRTVAAEGNREAAEPLYRTVTKLIDQAASKGLLHKNAAARTKSRLCRALPKRDGVAG